MPGQQDDLVEEIQFWLRLSKLFFKAFGVERHLGRQWFLINTLLGMDPAKPITISHVIESLPTEANTRSSPYHDVSVCLEDLRESGYIELNNRGQRAELARSAFPVGVTISIEKKLLRRAHRYAQGAAKAAGKRVDLSDAQAIAINRTAYNFGITTYMKPWREVLERVAAITFPKGTSAAQKLVKTLLGSTEYFVMFHALWEAALLGDDEDGFDADRLRSLHHETRFVGDPAINASIQLMIKHGILLNVAPDGRRPRYKLASKYLDVLTDFGHKLPDLSVGWKSAVLEAIADPSSAETIEDIGM